MLSVCLRGNYAVCLRKVDSYMQTSAANCQKRSESQLLWRIYRRKVCPMTMCVVVDPGECEVGTTGAQSLSALSALSALERC
jgi:hypothetical protein